jgi:hypothetical protein
MPPLLPLLKAGELPAEGKSCIYGVIRDRYEGIDAREKGKCSLTKEEMADGT